LWLRNLEPTVLSLNERAFDNVVLTAITDLEPMASSKWKPRDPVAPSQRKGSKVPRASQGCEKPVSKTLPGRAVIFFDRKRFWRQQPISFGEETLGRARVEDGIKTI